MNPTEIRVAQYIVARSKSAPIRGPARYARSAHIPLLREHEVIVVVGPLADEIQPFGADNRTELCLGPGASWI